MSKTKDNFKKYQETVIARGYTSLKSQKLPKDINDIMKALAKEGQELLDREELNKCKQSLPITSSPSKDLEQALASKDVNPYIQARGQVLKNLTEEKRNRILEMERTGHIENGTYQEFVRMIQKLGDNFSK
jgi:glutamyl-tRNA reductase